MTEESLKLIKELGFDEYWEYAGVRPTFRYIVCGKNGCIAKEQI